MPTILFSPIVIPSVARNLLYARGICASAVEVSHAKSGFLPSVGMTRFGETIGVEIGRLVQRLACRRAFSKSFSAIAQWRRAASSPAPNPKQYAVM